MKVCVFLGPSLPENLVPVHVDVLPPAAMGSVYQAVQSGYRIIGIVDGVFGNVPSVWHKEILFAMAQGVIVVGAGSIGALRASELWQYGMIGLGSVFRLYRAGALVDDDEVCLMHGPKELSYVRITEPMVNLRFTARRMQRAGLLRAPQETEFVRRAKSVFFGSRTRECVLTILRGCAPQNEGDIVTAAFDAAYFDVKGKDALRLVKWVGGGAVGEWVEPSWSFPQTRHWRQHFCSAEDEAQLFAD